MGLQGSAIALMFLSSLLCLPPYLALQLFQRSYRRARRHGIPVARHAVAVAACLVAFLFNLAAFVVTVRQLANGNSDFGRVQALAIAVAWVTFWLWLFLALVIGRSLGRGNRLH